VALNSPRDSDGDGDRSDCATFAKILCDHKFLSPLLIFVPCGLVYGFTTDMDTLTDHERQILFWTNFLGLIPMAWLIGKSTEDVADGVGELFGALINATFGNIVEVLLCIHAVNNGECLVTQLTLIGSILSNLLLVLGTAFLYGGYNHGLQRFSKTGARMQCSLLTLSVLAISLPTAYSNILQAEDRDDDVLRISRYASILLFMIYAQFLYFQFKYPHLFEEQKESEDDDDDEDKLSFKGGCVLLFCCTGLTAWGTHYLIHSITGNINFKLINKDFIAVILLPIIGNAAEHYTAILVAGKDKMDLTLGVAVGSSVQMALLVTPVSVLWGWVAGTDMTLDFHLFPTVALTLSVIMVSSIISDGQSTWLQGSLLVSTYVLISLIYFMERDSNQAPAVVGR
jgi:Ca2+:H+ antiporter